MRFSLLLKWNTFSLSGYETETVGRQEGLTMDLAEAAEAEQTVRNSPLVSEVRANLVLFFLFFSSWLFPPGEQPLEVS